METGIEHFKINRDDNTINESLSDKKEMSSDPQGRRESYCPSPISGCGLTADTST